MSSTVISIHVTARRLTLDTDGPVCVNRVSQGLINVVLPLLLTLQHSILMIPKADSTVNEELQW